MADFGGDSRIRHEGFGAPPIGRRRNWANEYALELKIPKSKDLRHPDWGMTPDELLPRAVMIRPKNKERYYHAVQTAPEVANRLRARFDAYVDHSKGHIKVANRLNQQNAKALERARVNSSVNANVLVQTHGMHRPSGYGMADEEERVRLQSILARANNDVVRMLNPTPPNHENEVVESVPVVVVLDTINGVSGKKLEFSFIGDEEVATSEVVVLDTINGVSGKDKVVEVNSEDVVDDAVGDVVANVQPENPRWESCESVAPSLEAKKEE